MKKYSNEQMVRLRNVLTFSQYIMSEPIYKNRRSAKYSFLNVANESKILNVLNSLDYIRAQTVIRFLRIFKSFYTKMNNAGFRSKQNLT